MKLNVLDKLFYVNFQTWQYVKHFGGPVAHDVLHVFGVLLFSNSIFATNLLAEIETEIRRLALRARENQLSLAEMEGGTFSITNGGVFGSMLSTPILNPPQAAILGMHNIVERPMAINGEVKIRPVMFLALSYDHRLVDGQQSVSFLVRLKQLLETPARMILGV